MTRHRGHGPKPNQLQSSVGILSGSGRVTLRCQLTETLNELDGEDRVCVAVDLADDFVSAVVYRA